MVLQGNERGEEEGRGRVSVERGFSRRQPVRSHIAHGACRCLAVDVQPHQAPARRRKGRFSGTPNPCLPHILSRITIHHSTDLPVLGVGKIGEVVHGHGEGLPSAGVFGVVCLDEFQVVGPDLEAEAVLLLGLMLVLLLVVLMVMVAESGLGFELGFKLRIRVSASGSE